jgi:hypothetical protein
MSSTHGGARDGAGRPLKSYKGNQYTGDTPIEWLWRELAQRFGQEIANEIHLAFNREKRIYEQERLRKSKRDE